MNIFWETTHVSCDSFKNRNNNNSSPSICGEKSNYFLDFLDLTSHEQKRKTAAKETQVSRLPAIQISIDKSHIRLSALKLNTNPKKYRI